MFELQHDFGMLGRAAGVGLIGLCYLQPIRSQQWTQVTNQRPDMSCELRASLSLTAGSLLIRRGGDGLSRYNPDLEMKNGKRHGNKNAQSH